MNTAPKFNSVGKNARRLEALRYGLSHPPVLRKSLQDLVRSMYEQSVQDLVRRGYEESLHRGTVKQQLLSDVADVDKEIRLKDYGVRDGNVTSFELMAIATLAANCQPKRVLEIGTFDGNTTLQIALNTPVDAMIHTIDLPEDHAETSLPTLDVDVKYVQDKQKLVRKYIGSEVKKKVVQHFGDSTTYDISNFTKEGKIDFCFIDGGHSYECVKSDTEKVLKIMAPKGIILWHDFTVTWPGVCQYLCEFSKKHPLVHITGTNLAMMVMK